MLRSACEGQTGQDSGGYAIFDTPEDGLRAMMIDLKKNIARGLNTLATLIPVYAPPSDNPTATYISNVSAWSGIDPNQTLAASEVPKLETAISLLENREQPYSSQSHCTGCK